MKLLKISYLTRHSEVLNFSIYKQFSSITNKLSSMSQKELENREEENSFKFYRSILVYADKEWATLDSDEKIYNSIIKIMSWPLLSIYAE